MPDTQRFNPYSIPGCFKCGGFGHLFGGYTQQDGNYCADCVLELRKITIAQKLLKQPIRL